MGAARDCVKVLLNECVWARSRWVWDRTPFSNVWLKGWSGIKNRHLLTLDQDLSRQQNLAKFKVALLLLLARSNPPSKIQPLLPQILGALEKINPRIVAR
jgi:hypothetical protein